jgi:hypothetical protein
MRHARFSPGENPTGFFVQPPDKVLAENPAELDLHQSTDIDVWIKVIALRAPF